MVFSTSGNKKAMEGGPILRTYALGLDREMRIASTRQLGPPSGPFLCYNFHMEKLSETLKERGYVQQFSSKKLEEITDGAKRTLYLGIDPSADSLQVGQLQAFLILRHFLEDGHKVILLIGGGTGMIGDPGGKSVERPLLPLEQGSANAEKIDAQARRTFSGAD